MIRVHLRKNPFHNDTYQTDLSTYTVTHEDGIAGTTDSHGNLLVQDKKGNLVAGYQHYLWHSFDNTKSDENENE